jgi:excisionase family DNA binding protein
MTKQANHNAADALRSELEGEATAKEAADFLDVSLRFITELLDKGLLPYRQVENHRRIPYADLVAYREKERACARKAMRRLTRESEDLGLYDLSEDHH